jgi:chromosome segregation ATPase
MHRLSAFVLGMMAWILMIRAAGPDDQFIVVYNLIQEAERAVDVREAGRLYEEAQAGLRQIQKGYPNWNERVISYRLRYCGEKLEGLKAARERAGPVVERPGAVTNGSPAVLAPSGEVLTQFNELNERIRRMALEKQMLEARLREALTAQPVPVDPRELQAAVGRITELQATNQVLMSQLERQQAERRNLVDKVVADEANQALAETRKALEEQRQAAIRMQKERQEIENRLQGIQGDTVQPLKLENQTLKQQVSDLRASTDKGRQVAELSGRLTRLQTDFDLMRQNYGVLTAEKAALEKQVEELKARQTEEGIVRMAQLETELAVARAESERSALRADELMAALEQEKKSRTAAEEGAKGLEERVSQLTARTEADAEALKVLEAALAVERAERAQADALLKAAEERLKVLAVSADPSAAVLPEVEVRLVASRAEVAQLQEAVRASAQRESELESGLAQEMALRNRLEKEKRELEERLAEMLFTFRERTEADRALAESLEQRIEELELERQAMQVRLEELTRKARRRGIFRFFQSGTPRERAMEFRGARP